MWLLCANPHVVLTDRQPKKKITNKNTSAFSKFIVTMYTNSAQEMQQDQAIATEKAYTYCICTSAP